MELREVKVGNYYQAFSVKDFRVDVIEYSFSKKEYTATMYADLKDITKGGQSIEIANLSGIPITEAFLTKNGFFTAQYDKQYMHHGKFGGSYQLLIGDKETYFIAIDNNGEPVRCSKPIRSVHEMQNAVDAIIRKPITFRL